MKLDDSKILFVIHKQNAEHYAACLQSIQELKMPPGKSCEVVTWDDSVKVSQGIMYSELAKAKDAKYKIYLPDSTCFVAENALVDMIAIFEADASIGMLGVSGAKELPVSCRWQEADTKLGALYMLQPDGNVAEEKYTLPENLYEKVQCIGSILMATQYDWRWCDANNDNAVAAAHSLECIRHGYNVVVPRQETAWCLSLSRQDACQDDLIEVVHEYAPYLQSAGIEMKGGNWLGMCGQNVQIDEQCCLANPQNIMLHDHVVLGKNCYIKAGTKVSIGHDTVIGDMAYLSDYATDVQDGVPVLGIGPDVQQSGGLLIGHHSCLERNVTVLGAVEIGCGCLIKANSTVGDNIPHHCVAAGNPARVIKALDYEDGKWLAIRNEAELQKLLEKRRNTQPILTIGIPTYNRSYYLDKCLQAIYRQLGDDDIAEVFISDNASSDNTREIAAKYQGCLNLRYHRNKENIGSRNFENVWESAYGKYVVAVGDDDYFCGTTIYSIVQALYQNQGVALLSMLESGEDSYSVYRGNGMNDFVDRVSYVSTYISGLVMKTSCYRQIEDKLKFGDTSLNQVYLQLEILRNTPDFAVLYGHIFGAGTGEACFNRNMPMEDRGCLGKIFIKQYFDILESFCRSENASGLSADCIRSDKKNVMEKFFLPWCKLVTSVDNAWKIDEDIFDILQSYYADEVYYAEIKTHVEHYLNKQRAQLKN